jgi:hypothetical protein
LGSKLVHELGLEPSVDTLGRWMAHYIADLMVKVKGASGEEKELAEKNCFEAILELWKHRAEMPNGKRPHEDLEPVVRAIKSLDPDDDMPRYFRSIRPAKGEDEKQSEMEAWLDVASNLDYSAKVLIAYCLAEAANAALDKSKEWVQLAEAAGADDGISETVARFLSRETDLGREPNPSDVVCSQLQNRMQRLEAFTNLAGVVLRVLRTRLEVLLPSKEGS